MSVFAAFLALLAFSATSTTNAQTPVNVDIYYESLCPDSIAFITKQLYPTYKKMAKYMKVNFIPYGNSNTTMDEANGGYTFVCQHGPAECYGNKIQSCALVHLQDEMKKVDFIKCMMMAPNDASQNSSITGLNCATDLNIDFKPIQECFSGREGNETLNKMGMKTKQLTPPLKSVPAIAFNMKYNVEEQKMITSDFMAALCSHITTNKPTECSGRGGAAFAGPSVVFALAALLPAVVIH